MNNAICLPKLWRFLITVNEFLESALKPLAKKNGITTAQLKVIYFVHILDRPTVGAIAEAAGLARTNTSSMCKKLSKMGFLNREKSGRDERVVEITLTQSGISAANAIENIFTSYENGANEKNLAEAVQILSDLLKETKGR